jgi:hypothetical protein
VENVFFFIGHEIFFYFETTFSASAIDMVDNLILSPNSGEKQFFLTLKKNSSLYFTFFHYFFHFFSLFFIVKKSFRNRKPFKTNILTLNTLKEKNHLKQI